MPVSEAGRSINGDLDTSLKSLNGNGLRCRKTNVCHMVSEEQESRGFSWRLLLDFSWNPDYLLPAEMAWVYWCSKNQCWELLPPAPFLPPVKRRGVVYTCITLYTCIPAYILLNYKFLLRTSTWTIPLLSEALPIPLWRVMLVPVPCCPVSSIQLSHLLPCRELK